MKKEYEKIIELLKNDLDHIDSIQQYIIINKNIFKQRIHINFVLFVIHKYIDIINKYENLKNELYVDLIILIDNLDVHINNINNNIKLHDEFIIGECQLIEDK